MLCLAAGDLPYRQMWGKWEPWNYNQFHGLTKNNCIEGGGGYTIPLRVGKGAVKSIATRENFFVFKCLSADTYKRARIPVCDLADRKFLALSKLPAANTMKVNNTSSKISDVGFEWISANLDQISLYVPNFALVGLSIFFFLY